MIPSGGPLFFDRSSRRPLPSFQSRARDHPDFNALDGVLFLTFFFRLVAFPPLLTSAQARYFFVVLDLSPPLWRSILNSFPDEDGDAFFLSSSLLHDPFFPPMMGHSLLDP